MLLLFRGSPASPVPSELLLNGGFELFTGTADDDTTDTFDAWTNATDKWGNRVEATTSAHTGNYALKFSSLEVGREVYQEATTLPGAYKRLMFYTHGDGTVSGRYALYDVVNATWLCEADTGVIDTAWTEVTYDFIVPAGCTTLRVSLLGSSAEGSVYFDDVSLWSTALLIWNIWIDWDNNGSYESDEADRVTDLKLERGRDGAFSDFAAGKLVLTLENNDRRFDPWNHASPLYPNVMPRRAVQVQVTHVGTTYTLFTGKIEEIEPIGPAGQRTVTITAYDGLRELSQETMDATLQEGVTTDEAIGVVLDAIGWPAGDRDLDVSVQEMAYWWAKSSGSPRERLDELARSEHGALFVGGDGKVRFIARTGYTTGAAVLTFANTEILDVALVNPWDSIYNGVDIKCYPISLSAEAVLWALLDNNVYIAPGETLVLWAEFADEHAQPAAGDDVISPLVATTDYTANTEPDGSGDDMTADLGVAMTVYASRAKLTCTNGGSQGLYITALQVRGKAITQTPVQVRHENAASQTTYGRRWLTIDVPWQQSVARAVDLATALAAFYATPRAYGTIDLVNRFPDILELELCDRVYLRLEPGPIYVEVPQLMQVQRITLQSGRTMQELFGTFELTPAEVQTSWLLGSAGAGELGATTWLGY